MIEPFIKLGVVGIAGHAVEMYLERSGRPGAVLYVKIGTYVVCGLIAAVEWRHFFRVLGGMFGFYLPW